MCACPKGCCAPRKGGAALDKVWSTEYTTTWLVTYAEERQQVAGYAAGMMNDSRLNSSDAEAKWYQKNTKRGTRIKTWHTVEH